MSRTCYYLADYKKKKKKGLGTFSIVIMWARTAILGLYRCGLCISHNAQCSDISLTLLFVVLLCRPKIFTINK